MERIRLSFNNGGETFATIIIVATSGRRVKKKLCGLHAVVIFDFGLRCPHDANLCSYFCEGWGC